METTEVVNVFRQAQSADAQQATPLPRKGDNTVLVHHWSQKKLLYMMSFINMINAVVLVAGGVLVFILPSMSLIPSFQTITICAYVCFLGLTLCCVECNLSFMQRRIRQHCGFMFSYFGRAIFLLFTSSVSFSIGAKESLLMLVIAISTAANAVFNFFVLLVHPAFRSGDVSLFSDPYANGEFGEDAVAAYLQKNPHVALKAMKGTVAVANVIVTAQNENQSSVLEASSTPSRQARVEMAAKLPEAYNPFDARRAPVESVPNAFSSSSPDIAVSGSTHFAPAAGVSSSNNNHITSHNRPIGKNPAFENRHSVVVDVSNPFSAVIRKNMSTRERYGDQDQNPFE